MNWFRYVLPEAVALFGAVFVVMGLRTLTAASRRRRSWLHIQGYVTGSQLRAISDSATIALAARYTAPDGRERDVVNRYSSNLTITRPGKPVELLVNPDNFDDAVFAGGLHGGGCAGVMFTFVGVLFAVFGLGGTYFVFFRH